MDLEFLNNWIKWPKAWIVIAKPTTRHSFKRSKMWDLHHTSHNLFCEGLIFHLIQFEREAIPCNYPPVCCGRWKAVAPTSKTEKMFKGSAKILTETVSQTCYWVSRVFLECPLSLCSHGMHLPPPPPLSLSLSLPPSLSLTTFLFLSPFSLCRTSLWWRRRRRSWLSTRITSVNEE